MPYEDHCGREDDEHAVSVQIQFGLTEDEDGDVMPVAAAVNSHVHNVPVELAATTLLVVAHKFLADHMAHETFDGFGHKIAHAMADASAKAYLIQVISNMPDHVTAISIDVPDDISTLLEGD
jgi:hypothetical protein